ncbi:MULTISPECIES: hypothetical protein [Xanthomonas]|uniref:hypothetical protein n=1 Tax=Xanthomonas TaxID=338 RepID=UPI00070B5203|nr:MULTISPECIES: hypothetical protein [Xanthomonas]MBO9747410.1 hypothetical protein [Xanthomonas phaseoli pv. dieffenbachiae]MBO9753070.1 hypothetical protein [Xanthomonas phaseoli pv. dieffenbachiae]MBO9878922.1 hypothetical protein [Xanthomonas sp. D-99]MBO9891938.1 hypothetical protein [Xanthomonas sp. D-36-1]OQP76272.1 hypothetical protein IB69_011135 [Xanthomonas citri]
MSRDRFGATLEQIHRFYVSLCTISTQSDMVPACDAPFAQTTRPARRTHLDVTRQMRGLVDTVTPQRLGDERPASPDRWRPSEKATEVNPDVSPANMATTATCERSSARSLWLIAALLQAA